MVVGRQNPATAQRDPVNFHQMPQGAGIFRRQHIGRVQYIQRPKRDVACSTYRRRDQIQTRIQTCGLYSGRKRIRSVLGFGHGVPALAVPALPRQGVYE